MQFHSRCKNHTEVTGQQTSPCLATAYRASIENFQKYRATFRPATVFVPLKVYIKGKLRVWRVQKCNFLVGAKTAPPITCPHTSRCLAIPYRASNENFRKFGDTFHHGTVIASMQSIY